MNKLRVLVFFVLYAMLSFLCGCDCTDNFTCHYGDPYEYLRFCQKTVGDCQGEGFCTAPPLPEDSCDVYDPVCGCDGKTYNNKWCAYSYSVNVDYLGPCEGDPPVTTSSTSSTILTSSTTSTSFTTTSIDGEVICKANYECPMNYYCKKPNGDCNTIGECAETPISCPYTYLPVCGCDNITYSNSCWAAAEGVNVSYDGECNP